MNRLDAFLNRITMYQLVLASLILILAVAVAFGYAGILPHSGWSIIGSTSILLVLCWLVNIIFAKVFGAPRHDDSAYITALILALIVPPLHSIASLEMLIWAPILAIAGKYIMAVRKQHVFNPAALAVVITALVLSHSAIWWVANVDMIPTLVITGWLIVRKLRRWDVVLSFLVVAVVAFEAFGLSRGSTFVDVAKHAVTTSPLLFFAAIMLTEPLTMPPTRRYRLMYGALIGFLFVPQVHIGSVYSTPELALVVGNVLFYLITRRQRVVLQLQRIERLSSTIADFVFTGPRLRFHPGQYFEWGLPHHRSDNRGQRRYFTVASSPTESEVRIGVKFYTPASSFKQSLSSLKAGSKIVVAQQDGDFVMPADTHQPLLFIAGGIGVTPFRSMIKYLLDTKQSRQVTLLYLNARAEDFVYHQLFDSAERELGIRTIYVLTDPTQAPKNWAGEKGPLDAGMIQRHVPDALQRRWYLSGPHGMVAAYVKLAHTVGVPKKQVITDYFPGFA